MSIGPKVEKVVHSKSEGFGNLAITGGGTWKMAYTNVDCLVLVIDEVNEFLKTNETSWQWWKLS